MYWRRGYMRMKQEEWWKQKNVILIIFGYLSQIIG